MNIIEDTKAEWRELGFFYERIDQKKEWIFKGDKAGLLKLSEVFKRYGQNEKNRPSFEHDHYGPYMYFKLMTMDAERGFNDNVIYGSLEDIVDLGRIVEKRVIKMKEGEVESLRNEYNRDSEYDLKIILEPEGFDPVSVDAWIKQKESEQAL